MDEQVARALAEVADERFNGTDIPLFFASAAAMEAALRTMPATSQFNWVPIGRLSKRGHSRHIGEVQRWRQTVGRCKKRECARCFSGPRNIHVDWYIRVFVARSPRGDAKIKAIAACLCMRNCLGCVMRVREVTLPAPVARAADQDDQAAEEPVVINLTGCNDDDSDDEEMPPRLLAPVLREQQDFESLEQPVAQDLELEEPMIIELPVDDESNDDDGPPRPLARQRPQPRARQRPPPGVRPYSRFHMNLRHRREI